MFEQFVKHPRALARHRHSPLAEERRRYLAHCVELGMAHETVRSVASYLLIITDYLRLGERPNDQITPAEVEAEATRWANRHNAPSRSKPTPEGRRYFSSY